MQRLVKWVPGSREGADLDSLGRNNIDISGDYVGVLDLTVARLARIPELQDALTHNGTVGRVVSHTHETAGGYRIYTFLVEWR
jgi:hypothetical protein